MKKNKSRFIWYVIASGCLLLFLLIIISSVLNVGTRLREISSILEYIFYALVVIIFFFAIVNPIIIILKSPSLAIATTLDPTDGRVVAIYKKVAKNIVKNNDLPEEQKLLLTKYNNKNELLLNLQFVFEQRVKGELNKIILHDAKIVMISTALSQSARMDMISAFTVNLKMIKELVVKCGFRPSMKNLSKLTVNVFGTALIAEGLENLSLDDILPQNATNMLANVPFVKPLMESVIQGIANSLMTIRIGIITRKYLFTDGAVVTKEEIRRQALKESMKMIPLVIAETITFFPKRVVRFFSKEKKDSDLSQA